MAFLTSDTFHVVTFLVPTDAAWTALSPNVPGIPAGDVAEAIYNGDPIVLYVLDASTGSVAFQSGQGYGFDDTLIDSSVAMTNYTLTDVASASTVWGKTGGGNPVYYLDGSSGLVKQISSANVTTFKAFLP